MIKGIFISVFTQWHKLLQQFLVSFAALFSIVESYEVTTNTDLIFDYYHLVFLSIALALLAFVVDGLYFSGFLSRKIELFKRNFGSSVIVEFGDLLDFSGWKVIGVNDFFDSKVDQVVISSNTLHGKVLDTFWSHRSTDWDQHVANTLDQVEGTEEQRTNGKSVRYPIGTTVPIEEGLQKFLFTAIAKTSLVDGVTTSDSENIICAVRGMLRTARVVCANRSLNIPLIGSGLSRVGIPNKVLLDLIICGIYEEIKKSNVTETIRIVLDPGKFGEINLLDIKRKWN